MKKEGVECEEMVCDAAGRIVDPFSLCTFAQAALTPKLGGLGLHKSVEQVGMSPAFNHARHGSGLNRSVRCTCVRQASYAFDEEMHKHLVDSAPDEREKQRLLRVARPHAGSSSRLCPRRRTAKIVF